MHLAYLDDSGTHAKNKSRFQVMAAVLIEGWEFEDIELAIGTTIQLLVPNEKLDKFEEFHAWELFGGFGPFEGVDQEKRLGTIGGLLTVVCSHDVPIIYGAVNIEELATKPYGSADPLDICFRICMEGIESWAASCIKAPATTDSDLPQNAHPVVVLVADDFAQSKTKETLKRSFRQFRKKMRPPKFDVGSWHLHDDFYFGDSKESIGIQLADLCGHIIRRHLEGDPTVAGFYDIIESRIVHQKVEPQP